MYWSARPFVRIVIFFIAGIYSYYSLPVIRQINIFFLIFSVLVLLITAIILSKIKWDISYNPVKGSVFALLIFFSGLLISSFHFPQAADKFFSKKGTFLGEIIAQPAEKTNIYKTVIRIRKNYDSLIINNFKIIAYIEKSDSIKPAYGDIIIFKSYIKPPEPPKNPEEFDYRNFLIRKGISHVTYLNRNAYKILGNKPPNKVKQLALKLRNTLLKALQQNGIRGEEYSVAAAILLGYDDTMDDAVRENYQKAGAMHVLCVSGLHAGIVYLVFNFLLAFLNKKKKQRLVKTVLLLIIVWFYAFLTGLSPSILRATVMISFFIIGNEIKRDKDAYNTLAMSAFFLLLYNPAFLFDVGFQLSYAAVFGIITFYPPLNRLIWLKSKLLKKLWSVIAVSLAAQLGTFPLVAHYFHTFPTYFLLTNIIIFPFSFLIVTGGLFFIFVFRIPVISKIVATILSGMIYLMNFSVSYIAKLPGSNIQDIYFPWFKVIIVYIIIFSFFAIVILKKKRYLFFILASLLLLVVNETIHRYITLNNNRLIVYNIQHNGSAADFITGKHHILLTNNRDFNKINYFVNNLRIKMGLKKNNMTFDSAKSDVIHNFQFYDDLISFNGLRIAKPSHKYFPAKNKMKVDNIWITQDNITSPEDLLDAFRFKKIILDASVSSRQRNKWVKFLTEKEIPFYDISEKGALIINLNQPD